MTDESIRMEMARLSARVTFLEGQLAGRAGQDGESEIVGLLPHVLRTGRFTGIVWVAGRRVLMTLPPTGRYLRTPITRPSEDPVYVADFVDSDPDYEYWDMTTHAGDIHALRD